MGSTEAQLKGPDFKEGIAVSQLTDGVPLLGHADGHPILLTRIGEEFFAVGASCTHYGGPLAEGLVSGDTVRCPWHHACFSLRYGEALRAPALNPLPCWTVRRDGDRITVGDKIERKPLAPTYPLKNPVHPTSIVIVGGGAAGSAATEMARRCGYSGNITIVDPDRDAPYDRPNLSKDYLAGSAPEEWIPLRPPGFYEEHGVRVIRTAATKIDVGARKLQVADGAAVPFDMLLLATGAQPIELPIPGKELPHVHYLRSLADCRKLIAALPGKRNVVVIGASFIGLEVAAALRTRKLDVNVVAPETIPLERVLGKDIGEFVRDFHESKGVKLHLGRKPATITATGVTLDDGSTLAADLVVIGVGVRPRIDLATDAGLATDRGVLVNRYLETSVPGIFAAGDIARFPDARFGDPIRIEHWVVAQRMGQTAARNMLGAREAFKDAPFFWSAHYDVSINYVGHAERFERVVVDGSAADHNVAARFESPDGRLLALATIFRDDESLKAETQIEQEARLSS